MITGIALSIFSLAILLVSVVIHELAHGYVAYSLGDPTAKYEGRLTLNPLKHLDPFGSVLLPLLLFVAGSPFLIGWAKPVPVNPYNFTDQKWGSFKVALAGPATNIAVALILGVFVRILAAYPVTFEMATLLSLAVLYNVLLAIFNLVPIPPLDGSWVLFTFLPLSMEYVKVALQQYGIFLLIFFIFFGGLTGIQALAGFFYRIITGFPGLPIL